MEWCTVEAHMTTYDPMELHFGDARSKVIELAAFLDRLERINPDAFEDFRMQGLFEAMRHLSRDGGPDRAGKVLTTWSDTSAEPIEEAHTKAACGVWKGH